MAKRLFSKIIKRDGRKVKFESEKIIQAIEKAGQATGEFGREVAEKLTARVLLLAKEILKNKKTPTVEEIQDIVELVLFNSPFWKTARAYAIYREQHRQLREIINQADVSLVDKYLEKITWEVRENSNMTFSLQGLNNYVSSKIISTYWLNKIYPEEIRKAHEEGDFHLHDLSSLSVYCVGWDLYDLLLKGFGGVPGKIESKPAKHFRSALGQLVNFLYTLQGETAGAVAVSDFDTLLAPFIYYDKLSYREVSQALQEFLFNMNVPTRVGFQTPFSNITLDLTPPPQLANSPVLIGGKFQDKTYKEFQREMDIFNRALLENFLEGDGKGRVFSFPIPTYNITKDFDWNNKNLDLLWQVTAKYGLPYFANFINSDMKPEDIRSMCCRLRIDNRKLEKRGGGLFGSSPLTGCYDEKTEILTEDGWKLFKDLKMEDKVFTLSENNRIELHQPEQLFKYDYEGEMIKFKAKSLDLLVTPNHRMVVDKKYKKKRTFVEAKDFSPSRDLIPKKGIWLGKRQEYFELPPVVIFQGSGPSSQFSDQEIEYIREMRRKGKSFYQIGERFNCNPVTIYNICLNENYGNRQRVRIKYEQPPLRIKMDDWLKFFGFWLAEGSTDNEKNAKRHGYRVIITQINREKKEEIKKVLDKLPFNYYEEENNLIICNKQLWAYLRQFGNKYTKFIPKEIKSLSKEQLKILFDWLVKGDGYIRKDTGQINYWTSSKKLADDLQEIILKLGWLATLKVNKEGKISEMNGRKIVSGPLYTISVQKTNYYRLREKNIERVYYKGNVYCCQVKNHTLFVRRNGKVCWSGNSIGVVTINMPRLGYLSKSKKEFKERLERLMVLAKNSLEIKRKTLEKLTDKGLYPYSRYYLSGIKKRFNQWWKNHFSTIGLVGMNEACLNLFGENIASEKSRKFVLEILDFMRKKLIEFQKETGNNYNLEATPAEGVSYRLPQIDLEKYPDIIIAGTREKPFYTNSTQLPVNYTDDIFEAVELQDKLQCMYTGGTVLHLFVGEKISQPEIVKKVVKKIFEKFNLPYLTITPTFSICPNCGYLAGEQYVCPKCKANCEVYSRVVGYLRPVNQWNDGKQEEFKERKTFKIKE